MPHKDPITRRLYWRNYRIVNKEKVAAVKHTQYVRNSDMIKARERKRYADKCPGARRQVIEAYGASCICCGESEVQFLCVDHVNNDGCIERKLPGMRSLAFYIKIIRAGFPSRYQLLCHNCNWASHRGTCPHKMDESNLRMAQ